MQYQDVSIQLVELPPIFSGDYQTNGQKYELIKRSRSASIMIRSEEDLEVVLDELTNANIPIASYQDKNVEGLPSFVIYRDMELFDIGIPFVHADEIQDVKDAFYNSLGIIRVYSQEDKNSEPFILEKNKSRVCDMAKQISSGYKYAKVWGESVKHAGQKVDMQHVLKEGDKVHLCRC